MKKIFVFLALSLALSGCERVQPDAVDPKNRVISYEREYGPKDIICHSGSLVTYDHKNVIIYQNLQHNSTILDVYENDTHEKIGLPVEQCIWRPHKKS